MSKKKKTTRYIILGIIGLIILLVILKKTGILGDSAIMKVATEKVTRRNITETISASGKIQPETEVKISPEVSGEIVDIFFKEGDKVKKGDLLLKIKPDIYISTLERMEASLNSAKANLANSKAQLAQAQAKMVQQELSYKRNKKLWEEKAISDADYENALAQYQSQQAGLKSAEESVKASEFSVISSEASVKEANENLIKTSIFAPMDGTMSKLNVEKGERVVGTAQMAGTELLTIANLNRMEVKVEVNENDIVRLSLGDTAKIEIDAYLNHPFTGVVTEIANSANSTGLSAEQVTTFDVKILILKSSYNDLLEGKPDNFYPLRPGMSATVDIQTEKVFHVIAIPVQCVTSRTDSLAEDTDNTNTTGNDNTIQEIVFVYKDNKVHLRQVTTGIQDNDYFEIKNGLKEGEEVVSAPYSAISRFLKNGMPVEKVDAKQLLKTADD